MCKLAAMGAIGDGKERKTAMHFKTFLGFACCFLQLCPCDVENLHKQHDRIKQIESYSARQRARNLVPA